MLRALATGTLLLVTTLLSSGCQIDYLIKNGYSQLSILNRRVPIEQALKDPKLTSEQKRKLILAHDARVFAQTDLGLKATHNYDTFVQLDGPYVTYVLSAAPKDELTHYLWHYPILGALPYRGYFNPDDAKKEAEKMKAENYDTYVRGVSAFSTLGWFRDPILSSMLGYRDHDLVSTIIHETTHATVYIHGEADFNERLAVFIGNKGAELFFAKVEGPNGKDLLAMKADNHDDEVFSHFISKEITDLEKWYGDRKGQAIPESDRQARIKEIQARFVTDAQPKMSSPDSYRNFPTIELNNARLLTYKLYLEDLSQFQIVFDKLGGDFRRMLDFCKRLENSKDPVADLALAAAPTTSPGAISNIPEGADDESVFTRPDEFRQRNSY